MKNIKFMSLIVMASMYSCQPKLTADIVGSWTTVSAKDLTNMRLSDRFDFYEDGTYTFSVFSNGDSLVKRKTGTYILDKSNAKLILYSDSNIKAINKLIALDSMYLVVEGYKGAKMVMKRIK